MSQKHTAESQVAMEFVNPLSDTHILWGSQYWRYRNIAQTICTDYCPVKTCIIYSHTENTVIIGTQVVLNYTCVVTYGFEGLGNQLSDDVIGNKLTKEACVSCLSSKRTL